MKEEKYAKKIKSKEKSNETKKSNPAKETKKSSSKKVTENKSVERATLASEQVVKPDSQKQQSSKSPTYNAATMLQNANKEMLAKKRRRNTAIGVTAGILLATAIIVPAVYLNGKIDINVSVPALQQDESFSVVVKRGYKIGDLQPKEIEGYTFEGFYKDANLTERYSDDDKITKDITIYAKYTANVYAITFPSSPYFTIEGEDIENNKAYAEYDSSYSFRVKLSAGYTESDIHVYLGETELIPVDGVYTITIKGDSTINITGVEINTYSVVYYDEDAETIIHSEEVDYNTASTYTDTPEKPADNTYTYTFSGWVYYDSGEPITDELTHVINNIKVKASYTATYIEYTIGNIPTQVTIQKGDQILTSSDTLHYGDEIAITYTPTTGYDMTSFNISGATLVSGDTYRITGNLIVTYTETLQIYTITIESNNTSYGTVDETTLSIPYGTTYQVEGNDLVFSNGARVTPTPASSDAQYTYTFTGWSETSGTITGEETIIANFERITNSYIVTIENENADYGSIDNMSITVPYGTVYRVENNTIIFETDEEIVVTATALDNTAQYTYAFKGWSVSTGSITGAMTIRASFTRTINQYEVSIESNNTSYGRVDTTSVTVDYGSTISETFNELKIGDHTIVATPTADTPEYDYTFTGWTYSSSTVTGEMTIVANFVRTMDEYIVTIESSNVDYGSVDRANLVVNYNTPITVEDNIILINGVTITAREKEDTVQYTYTFTGWTNATDPITGNRTIIANFERSTNSYTVTFYDENRSTVLASQYAEYGTAVEYTGSTPTKPADNTYTYTFSHWETAEGEEYDISSETITGDISVYAQYTATYIEYTVDNPYTQVTILHDGSPVNDGETLHYGDTVEITYIPTSGYEMTEFSVTGADRVGETDTYTVIGNLEITYAEKTTINYSDFIIEDGVVTGYTGSDTNVVIPSTYSISNGSIVEGTDYTVTGIGSSAFEDNASITSITIPEGVISIGNDAFRSCSSLTTITIPSSVTSIGSYAFLSCRSLTSITIPEGVTSIGDDAFFVCYRLVEVVNLSSLTFNVGDYGTSTSINPILEIITDESETKLITIDGNLYKDYDGERYFIKNMDGSNEIEIDSSATQIYQYAFYNRSNITSVTIPSSVTSIGEYTFSGCSSLTSITIPSSVTSIGDYAFNNCSSLTDVYYGGDINDWVSISFGNAYANPLNNGANLYLNGDTINPVTEINIDRVTSIGDYVFYGCSSLTSITIPESVTSIGNSAFYNCSSLSTVTFGENSQLTSIGNYAFRNCSSLTSITIPSGVTSIGEYTFSGCSSLTSITIPSSVTSIGDLAFNNCSSLTSIMIPSSVTSIGNSAFSDCSSLTSITIPSSVTSIGNRAFSDCSSLTTVTFGDNSQLTSIGSYVFQSCSNLTTVTFGDNSRLTSIGRNAFQSCSNLTTVTFGENSQLESIGSSAFSGCSSLTSITIPENVTSIGDGAFEGCRGLTELNFNATNMSDLSSGNDVFYNAGKNGSGITVNIGANVTRIPVYLFCPYGYNSNYSPNIVTVNFVEGSQCTEIGRSAFRYCISLTTVTFGENSQLTSIGSSAFSYCSNLTTVTFGENSQLTSIGDYAFDDCSSLTSITIPESVTSIGTYGFYNCTGLTEINFNATNMSDLSNDNYVFSYAGQNSTGIVVNIGANVTRIPAYLFYPRNNFSEYLPNIISVNFKEDSQCTEIGSYVFYGCSSLTDVYYGGDINDWVSISFGNTSANPLCYAENLYLNGDTTTPVTEINIDTATSIGAYAFDGWQGLTKVTIGDQVTNIGNYAFYNCSSLTSITISSSVTNIESGAFRYCYRLVEVINLSSLTFDVGDYGTSTSDNPILEIITEEIESQLTTINGNIYKDYNGERYFIMNIDGSTEITIDSSTTQIYQRAFYNRSDITSVTIPSSVTNIGNFAFYYCSSLTSITIPSSVTNIESGAFRYCYRLVEVINLSSLTFDVGDYGTSTSDNPILEVITEECETKLINIDGNLYKDYNGERYFIKNMDGSTEIEIDSSATQIYQYAFYERSDITSVTIPSSVTSIGSSAFYGCSNLTTVTFGENSQLTSIGQYAFYNCSSLTSITIPSSVTSIGSYAFYNCSNLTTVTFGDNSQLTSIGNNAFYYCSSLTSITIPESVTSIGSYAFYGCSSLTSVTFENTSGWYRATSSTATSGTRMTVTDPAQNATYLTDTYDYYYWKRNA